MLQNWFCDGCRSAPRAMPLCGPRQCRTPETACLSSEWRRLQNPGNKSSKINANVFAFLEVSCCKHGFSYPKSLPGTLAPSVLIPSTLALIFGAVPSWLQGGCCSPRCCICIQGRNREKIERVTPVSGKQEFSEKPRDRHLCLCGQKCTMHLSRETKACWNSHTGLDQFLWHGAGRGKGCKVVSE